MLGNFPWFCNYSGILHAYTNSPTTVTLGGGFKFMFFFTLTWGNGPICRIFCKLGWFNHQPALQPWAIFQGFSKKISETQADRPEDPLGFHWVEGGRWSHMKYFGNMCYLMTLVRYVSLSIIIIVTWIIICIKFSIIIIIIIIIIVVV